MTSTNLFTCRSDSDRYFGLYQTEKKNYLSKVRSMVVADRCNIWRDSFEFSSDSDLKG